MKTLPFALPFYLSLALAALFPNSARSCDLALALAIDVSGSVDPSEYQIQLTGLSEALRDPQISEALVSAEAALTLVLWTGSTRQRQTLGWTRMTSFEQLDGFADAIEDIRRPWWFFSTAIGEAIEFSATRFAEVPDCRARVIDISGDGVSNEGIAPETLREDMATYGVTVNALVIEGAEPGLTEYFRTKVITGPGAFAIRANGYLEYPDRIRRKLARELVVPLAERPGGCDGVEICDHRMTASDHNDIFYR